jgi:hypothetical protein
MDDLLGVILAYKNLNPILRLKDIAKYLTSLGFSNTKGKEISPADIAWALRDKEKYANKRRAREAIKTPHTKEQLSRRLPKGAKKSQVKELKLKNAVVGTLAPVKKRKSRTEYIPEYDTTSINLRQPRTNTKVSDYLDVLHGSGKSKSRSKYIEPAEALKLPVGRMNVNLNKYGRY